MTQALGLYFSLDLAKVVAKTIVTIMPFGWAFIVCEKEYKQSHFKLEPGLPSQRNCAVHLMPQSFEC